ncbi:TonB-dependent receptor [Dyella solisilvae]|nr:TonB-dependent receptor [Dyella solisilvae]
MTPHSRALRLRSRTTLALCLASALAAPVWAADVATTDVATGTALTQGTEGSGPSDKSGAASNVTDLGSVNVQATTRKDTAAAVAPTQASLTITQPQSVISRDFIENSKSPVADFSSIAAIAPSVTGGISSNGPGLGETKNSIRGFQDGQFNITWDGIPFGDTNGPTHHSTAYFPASVIGAVVVERGPGTASDIGQATFGGSINLLSRELLNEQNFEAYTAYGTWNTQLYGFHADTGAISAFGDTKIGVNLQHQSTDGARTDNSVSSNNGSLKMETPLGDKTLLTVNLNYNRESMNALDKDNGLTMAQVAQWGKDYSLSGNSFLANCTCYNPIQKTTTMDYVRLQSDLGNGWGIDNQTYYYDYTNNTISSNTGNVPGSGLGSVTNSAGKKIANQMPGYVKLNAYDVWGNVFRGTKQFDAGLARAGIWLEYSDTHRAQSDYNLLDMTPNYDQKAIPGVINGINNIKFDQKSNWFITQPFAEFEWSVTKDLTVTPGVKYNSTKLDVDAPVNQTARIPMNFSKTFDATLPFLTANYKLNANSAIYAQYAQGMLVPDVSLFQSTNATETNIKPQRSTNYQFGYVRQTDQWVFDTDVYLIDFSNKFAVVPGTTSQPVYYNQGGVRYKGIEGQITYMIGYGFSAYANGSINRATSNSTGQTIANAPDSTAAAGILYNQGNWNSSLIWKRTGTYYALDNNAYKMNAVSQADFNIGYTFLHPGLGAKSLKVQLGIFNIFDKQDPIAVNPVNATAGTATYGQANAGDTFLFQAARSFMLQLKADL